MSIDFSAFIAVMISATAAFFIATTTGDGKIPAHWRFLIVLCIAGVAYYASEAISRRIDVTFEERIEGIWLEIFIDEPNQWQSYGITYISLEGPDGEMLVGGYGFNAEGEMQSTWRTSTVVADGRSNSIHYWYDGNIFDEPNQEIDGQASVRFDPNRDSEDDKIQFAIGEFREEYSDFSKVQYQMIRLTPEMIGQYLPEVHDLEVSDYSAFIQSFHATREQSAVLPVSSE